MTTNATTVLDGWQLRGRCHPDPGGIFDDAIERAGTTDELFYPTEAHRAVCDPCPVREECLAYALDHPDVEGVWAGTTDYQRRQLRRPYSRRTCPACASDAVVDEGSDEVCLTCGISWAAAA